ncbi:GGDEF domain-containing protein [Marinospirillum alkaliphilum]|uniref:diguanylate cyclase n=1 Tax=Marinospirillum alkaliphilum DSM 21637 TaxID=1122209 RepID=A0A1K1Z890_9GAMM|nr:GGDEF domain-containing protein [Marinospirillum alkaliphilum]SFX70319.1 diguanylate cyclase (GGDEF) domain-containing protein [Marinospirillum alkaliphilum DSM 21637]
MDSPFVQDKSQLVAQQLRLRRSLMASGAGFAASLVMLLAWQLGYVGWEIPQLAAFLLLTSLGYLLFPWLIHSSRNLTFTDPSLTAHQLGWHLLVNTYAMYAAAEIRSLLIVNFILLMLFAVFRFHPRKLPLLAVLLLASYCLAVLAQVLWSPLDVHWSHETLIALVFLLALIGLSLLGAEIASLRLALKRRNAHLAAAKARIEELAVTDELTGLYNRRHLMRIIRRQKGLADRGNYAFSLAFVDLDYFKRINDAYGHGVGDQVLIAVAQEIRRTLRDVDYVARIGGEEFVLVLAQTGYQEALRIAERLRSDMERLIVEVAEDHPNLKLTASIGIATYHSPETVAQLMKRADMALYAAKGCGRNCIVGEQELPPDTGMTESMADESLVAPGHESTEAEQQDDARGNPEWQV